ncbi:dihydrofolate reductase family protein, partial [Kribbella solani]|uniref:dihydrofolate reductase family protein n=1 Tax=Kribbella solani TaxID=236067 RepID=UPI0029BBDB6F
MRKLIYWVHSSIDGYIDGPNGEFDWPVMGPELIAYSDALDRRVDTLLFGRPVWEMMVGFWPKAESVRDDPHTAAFAPFWRATPKIVFSHDYPGDEWTSQVIGGDLAEQVTELKSRPGQDLLLTGPRRRLGGRVGHIAADQVARPHVALRLMRGRDVGRSPQNRVDSGRVGSVQKEQDI